MAKRLFIALFLTLPSLVFGSAPTVSSSNELSILDAAIGKIKASPVQLDLKKTLKLALLDKVTFEKGSILLKNSKLRMEIKGKETTLYVYDGKIFWFEQRKPKDLGGGVLVSKINGLKLKTNSVFKIFLSEAKPSNTFRFSEKKESREGVAFTITPKVPEDFPDATKLKIKIDIKNLRILEISYWDELENETTYEFLKQASNGDFSDKKFRYKAPKGAEVTEL